MTELKGGGKSASDPSDNLGPSSSEFSSNNEMRDSSHLDSEMIEQLVDQMP